MSLFWLFFTYYGIKFIYNAETLGLISKFSPLTSRYNRDAVCEDILQCRRCSLMLRLLFPIYYMRGACL